MSIWRRFAISWLQQCIGEPTLVEIENLAHAIGKEVEVSNRNDLCILADTFALPENILTKISIKTEIIRKLRPDEIDLLIREFVNIRHCSSLQDIILLDWREPEIAAVISCVVNANGRFFQKPLACVQNPLYFDVDSGWISSNTSFQAKRTTFPQLTAYQFQVFNEALELLDKPGSKCMIQMPTGTGKTRTAVETICHILNSSTERKVVFWLADREELLEQAAWTFSRIWEHLGRSHLKLCRLWGSYSFEVPSQGCHTIYFAGLQKLNQLSLDSFFEFSAGSDLIVFDEAHKSIAKTYTRSIERLWNKSTGTLLLGLSATPGRGDGTSEANFHLAEQFEMKIVRIRCADSGTGSLLDWLRENRFLANATFREIDGLDVDQGSSQSEDFSADLLQKLGASALRNARVIEAIQQMAREQENRILLFAASVKSSRLIACFLQFLGFKAAHVDGETPEQTRRSIILSFQEGRTQILCNYGVLTEGFDCPKINKLVIARPTKSVVLYSQMLGRGLRGTRLGGTESCEVIQVRDNFNNLPNEQKMSTFFDRFWK